MNNNEAINQKELNELIERVLLPGYPPALPPSDIFKVVDNYAYVFPVDPDKPVRIVFEDEPTEEGIINGLYEKLKEICNENRESD